MVVIPLCRRWWGRKNSQRRHDSCPTSPGQFGLLWDIRWNLYPSRTRPFGSNFGLAQQCKAVPARVWAQSGQYCAIGMGRYSCVKASPLFWKFVFKTSVKGISLILTMEVERTIPPQILVPRKWPSKWTKTSPKHFQSGLNSYYDMGLLFYHFWSR